MGNKCGRHGEVRTLSRRNSKQELGQGALDAQIFKSKKKRRKGRKKGKWRLKNRKATLVAKGSGNLPPDLTNGAAWRVRTFSESSIQSCDYLSAEEEELTDVEEEFTSSDEDVGEYGERCAPNFFTFAGVGTYIGSFFCLQMPGISKPLQKAVIPHELCLETNVSPERDCWDQPTGSLFPLRGKNYLKDKRKIKTEMRPLYELKSVDFYSSRNKVDHIAQRLDLPSTDAAPKCCSVMPLLVVNWQAPMYPAKMFGKPFDGESLSVVAVFALREDFDPEVEIERGNLYPHTMELLKKFCADAVEDGGVPSRERLKMIPAMPNLEEWCRTKTFGKAEATILRKWQNKPMLVRPQVTYHNSSQYIEVDINIHDYMYATRRYFHSLQHCLKHGIMDMALVLEGWDSEELPEQVLASVRLQKIDFCRRFPSPPPLL